MAVLAGARLFNQCDAYQPLDGEWDVDSRDDLAKIGSVTVQYDCFLELDKTTSDLCFVIDARKAFKAELRAGETVMVAIDAKRLLALCEKSAINHVHLNSAIDYFPDGRQPSKHQLHASVQLFHSGTPRPEVVISAVSRIDLNGDFGSSGWIKLGSVTFTAASNVIPYRGKAQFQIETTVELGDAQLRVGYRLHAHDSGQDRSWASAGARVTGDLDFIAEAEMFRINAADIAVPYRDFRDAVMRNRANRLQATVSVARMSIGPETDAKTKAEQLQDRNWAVALEGNLTTSLTLAAGTGQEPTRLTLALGEQPAARLKLPPVFVQVGANKELSAQSLSLSLITADGPMKITLTPELRCRNRIVAKAQPIPIELDGRASASIRPTELLSKLAAKDVENAKLVLELKVQRDSVGTAPEIFDFKFEAGLRLEPAPPKWLICVDFGTSSIAAWIARNDARAGYRVPLGSWLSRLDNKHAESPIWEARNLGLRPSYLLPSHIGLSPQINLRADYDPLSLGDLALALPGEVPAQNRLSRLDRTYDISLPFPDSDAMPLHRGVIFSEPKKMMIGHGRPFVATADIPERRDGQTHFVRHVALGPLIVDCFDELGSYILLSSLDVDADDPLEDELERARKLTLREDLRRDRLDPDIRFGAILTHPSGIDRTKRTIYEEAGRRLIAAFTDLKAAQTAEVTLIPEALAAARHGIAQFSAGGDSIAGRTFVTLDIGAGTYDVTVIRCQTNAEASWKMVSHFGLAVGGSDLDQHLLGRIESYLRDAAGSEDFLELTISMDAFAASAGPNPLAERAARARLRDQFLGAKMRLTTALLAADRGGYRWERQRDLALEIFLGDLPGKPIAFSANAAFERPIGRGATLAVDPAREPAEQVRLRVHPQALSELEGPYKYLITILGEELPRIALGEAKRETADSPIVIVTGRTALWPPLYAAIEETVAANGGTMARPQPFGADEMKQAVVLGAIGLPRELLAQEAEISNPIAMISFKSAQAGPGGRITTRLLATADVVIRGSEKSGSATVRTDGPFYFARVLPGLEEALADKERAPIVQELYRVTGIEPFVRFEPEIRYPARKSADGSIDWTVNWVRGKCDVQVNLDSDEEDLHFSFTLPLGERVYGSD